MIDQVRNWQETSPTRSTPRLRPALLLLVLTLGLWVALSAPPPASAVVPGTNGKIVFTSNRDSGNRDIYVMNADGSGQTRLTDDPGSDFLPNWSPDGTQIAFVSTRDANNREIYVMNADGTGQTRLTNNAASDTEPAWSPDGTRIAFRSDRDGNEEIYVMNADGTGQTRLTSNAAFDGRPDWSPDGTQIAFESDRDTNLEIYVMNADGTGQTNISNNAANDATPVWSPDGTQIAFRSDRDGNEEIYIMNANGTGQTNLTNNVELDADPAWSPDGSQLVFTSDRDGNPEIFVMNADGSGQTNISNNPAEDFHPDWRDEYPIGVCPADPDFGTVGGELTTILGTGMGSPTRSKMVARITIPNSNDIWQLYGQMAGKEYNGVRYVRFIFGDKSFDQIQPETDLGDTGAISWWGEDVTAQYLAQTKPFVKGRWFLQKGMKKMRIPRAIVFYATHTTDTTYANNWSTFTYPDNFVAGTPGFDQTKSNILPIPETQAATDIVVQVAVTDVNRDPRTIDVIVTAGNVSEIVTLTGPTNKKSELLNLFEVTLENVPGGVDEVEIELVSVLDEGDSAALLGAAAHYVCEPETP